MRETTWPYVYVGGKVKFLEPVVVASDNFIGGPLELEIIGGARYPRLHRVLTLSPQLLEGRESQLEALPLVYGFQYSQTAMSYRLQPPAAPGLLADERKISDLDLDASTYDPEWPYKDYPLVLPLINLKVSEQVSISLGDLCNNVLRRQLKVTPDDVVVAFPTNRLMGFSMWGTEGDREDVLLIFVIELGTLRIAAWNSLPQD